MQKTTRASSMADDCNHMFEKQRHCMSHSPGKMNRKLKKTPSALLPPLRQTQDRIFHLAGLPKFILFLYLAWLQKSHLKSQISKEVCRSSKGLLRPSSKMELHACPTKMQPSRISTICDGYIHHFPTSSICVLNFSTHLPIALLESPAPSGWALHPTPWYWNPWAMMGHGRN